MISLSLSLSHTLLLDAILSLQIFSFLYFFDGVYNSWIFSINYISGMEWGVCELT